MRIAVTGVIINCAVVLVHTVQTSCSEAGLLPMAR